MDYNLTSTKDYDSYEEMMNNLRAENVSLKQENRVLKRRLEMKDQKSKSIKGTIAVILTIIVMFTICTTVILNIERLSMPDRYKLTRDVEEGDPEAIEVFNKYIEKDVYFETPKSIEAMALKYNLDYDKLYEGYNNSDYDSLQEFFNKEIKDKVK